MVWIEARFGHLISRQFVSSSISKRLRSSRRLGLICGPVCVGLTLLTLILAMAFGTCAVGHCSTGAVKALFGIATIQFDEVHIVSVIVSLAIIMRAYGWVLHDPMAVRAVDPPVRHI